tara:strand:- start:175 stop:558 length:384 start_codon:yes stop_codon:yes gene_type:complete
LYRLLNKEIKMVDIIYTNDLTGNLINIDGMIFEVTMENWAYLKCLEKMIDEGVYPFEIFYTDNGEFRNVTLEKVIEVRKAVEDWRPEDSREPLPIDTTANPDDFIDWQRKNAKSIPTRPLLDLSEFT